MTTIRSLAWPVAIVLGTTGEAVGGATAILPRSATLAGTMPLAVVARAAAGCGRAAAVPLPLPLVVCLPLAVCLPFTALPLTAGRVGLAVAVAARACLARMRPRALSRSSFRIVCHPVTPLLRAMSASCFLDRASSGSFDITRRLQAPGRH